MSYAEVKSSVLGWDQPIKNITVDYKGSPGLGISPTVLILDDLINKNVLEVVTPIPISAGPNIYSSFKIVLSIEETDFVIVITS